MTNFTSTSLKRLFGGRLQSSSLFNSLYFVVLFGGSFSFDLQTNTSSSQYQHGFAHPAIASTICNESTFVASCFPVACQTVLQHKSFAICSATWRTRIWSYPGRNAKGKAVQAFDKGPTRISGQGSSCEPCRRTGCNPHLYGTDTSNRKGTSTSPTIDEAHVRPRSWTLQDLQPSPCTPSHPTNRHVSCLASCCYCFGLGYWRDGTGGCHGMYRSR